jgi:hypothetical protein
MTDPRTQPHKAWNDEQLEQTDREGYTAGRNPRYNFSAQFSAEQTARFFGGGRLGLPTYDNPEIQAKVDKQRELLRTAWSEAFGALAEALINGESEQTAEYMLQQWAGTLRGNEQARAKLVNVMAELFKQALD